MGVTFGPDNNPASPPPAVPVTSFGAPKKSRRGLILGIVVLILIILLAAGGYALYGKLQTKENVQALPSTKIGVMFAFTGGSSTMGYGEMKGIQLAKKQLGADNIELIQMDSQCDKAISPGAMQRLVDQKVIAVIGDGCSSASVAALDLANKNKIPMISPSASSPKLSIPDDYFFRVVPPDTFQGAYLAKTVWDKGIKTTAVFYTNEPYGIAINDVFKTEYEKLGGKVLTSVTAESDVIELSSQISAIKKSNPGAVIFVPNSITSGAAAIKLAREAGITVPFFGGDAMYDRTLFTNAKTAAEGLKITSFPVGTKAFKQLLLTEYQGEELYAASQSYDAFESVYRAIKAGARTGEQVKEKLPAVSFEGVSAKIAFDKNGEISDPAYKYALLTVKDGSFVAE
jgi:branched-chain amino acid transport system substrate-binding protein